MLNWLEVSRGKLINNLDFLKGKLLPDVGVMAVVKANAYGHGLIEVAKILEPEVDWMAVVEIAEAIKLREAGIEKPILVMGYIEKDQYGKLFDNDLTPSVYSFQVLTALSQCACDLGRKINVHVEIDTGMNRTGFRKEDTENLIEKMKDSDLIWQGLYSHFYNENDRKACLEQLEIMRAITDRVKKDFEVPLVHMAKSQVTLQLPESQFNMVRVGGLLYGLSKFSDEVAPIGTFKARVGMIKTVIAGMAVGYDGCFRAPKDMVVAVVSAGYADGFRSFAPNTGNVLINGRLCPIVGRVCMNQAMVDVSEVDNLSVGDEVVIVGKQASGEITPLEYAEDTKSAFYEVMARIPDHVKRIIID